MATTTVRVSVDTHEALKRLAERTHQPVTRVLEQLVREAEARKLWQEYAEASRRLRSDPAMSAELRAEEAIWSRADADGLDPDEGESWREELRDAASW